jgi:hypothetical protein
VGLIARALELAGIATVMTSWNAGKTVGVAPPRATMTRLSRGATIGNPGDVTQQRRVIAASLALLAQPAPLTPVMLDEK